MAFLDGIGREHSRSQADYWNRRVESCHRRFLAACRTLAQVQRVELAVVLGQVGAASFCLLVHVGLMHPRHAHIHASGGGSDEPRAGT